MSKASLKGCVGGAWSDISSRVMMRKNESMKNNSFGFAELCQKLCDENTSCDRAIGVGPDVQSRARSNRPLIASKKTLCD